MTCTPGRIALHHLGWGDHEVQVPNYILSSSEAIQDKSNLCPQLHTYIISTMLLKGGLLSHVNFWCVTSAHLPEPWQVHGHWNPFASTTWSVRAEMVHHRVSVWQVPCVPHHMLLAPLQHMKYLTTEMTHRYRKVEHETKQSAFHTRTLAHFTEEHVAHHLWASMWVIQCCTFALSFTSSGSCKVRFTYTHTCISRDDIRAAVPCSKPNGSAHDLASSWEIHKSGTRQSADDDSQVDPQ